MSKARHSGLTVTAGITGAKARHSGLTVTRSVTLPKAKHSGLTVTSAVTQPRAHHSGLKVSSSTLVARARHSGLAVYTGMAAVPTQYIRTAGGLMVPLGPPVIVTPPYPVWGPYGELGAYVPDASTSGATWPAGSPPNGTLVGDQIITSPGTLLEGMEIFGRVVIRCANVTVRNCRIWGSTTAPTTNAGLIHCDHSACVNAVLEDNTLRPQTPTSYLDGIRGHDYKARRNNVSGTTDGISVVNGSAPTAVSNVEIDANYLHDFAYRPDPQQQDGHTHNDGTQIHGANGVKIRGNNYQGFIDPNTSMSNYSPFPYSGRQVSGQAILIQPQNANDVNIEIRWNYFDGWGEACVHIAPKNLPSGVAGLIDNIDIWANRFGRNQATVSSNGLKNTVRVKVSTTITNVDVPLSGDLANLYLDTLTPITVTT